MATGASQIFVEKVREAAAILGIGGGGGGAAYLSARMDDQSTSLTTADHVEFDDVLDVDTSGDIALSTAAGQSGGIITLAVDKTYLFMAALRTDFSVTNGVVRCRFRHNNLAAEFGSQLECLSRTGSSNAQSVNSCQGILAVSGEVATVELRITGVASLASVRGAGATGNSWLLVREIA